MIVEKYPYEDFWAGLSEVEGGIALELISRKTKAHNGHIYHESGYVALSTCRMDEKVDVWETEPHSRTVRWERITLVDGDGVFISFADVGWKRIFFLENKGGNLAYKQVAEKYEMCLRGHYDVNGRKVSRRAYEKFVADCRKLRIKQAKGNLHLFPGRLAGVKTNLPGNMAEGVYHVHLGWRWVVCCFVDGGWLLDNARLDRRNEVAGLGEHEREIPGLD